MPGTGQEQSRILVIEDEQAIRTAIKRALTQSGFSVTEAVNGLEGVQRARTEIPSLIISDINMEKVDGFEALSQLRQDPKTSDIPFILITGLSNPEGMRRGMALGADDYLTKPFTIQELLATVQARLRQHRLIRQAADSQMAELRNNLSAALPHEFLTPLHSVLGFTDLLRAQDDFSPAQTREMADLIHAAASRLQRLIENYLVYSRIETLRKDPVALQKLQTESTGPIDDLIQATATEITHRAQRGSDLRTQVAPGFVRISSDDLRRVLTELIENACKFSSPGEAIEVLGSAHGPEYHIDINDRGRGLDAYYIQWIGAYAQFDRPKQEQQGLGLGLVIAKGLIEVHGGTFQVESKPGEGTRIHLTLPAAPFP